MESILSALEASRVLPVSNSTDLEEGSGALHGCRCTGAVRGSAYGGCRDRSLLEGRREAR